MTDRTQLSHAEQQLAEIQKTLQWLLGWNSGADHGTKCIARGYPFDDPFCLKCETDVRIQEALRACAHFSNLKEDHDYHSTS
jgi:hypothetical protein